VEERLEIHDGGGGRRPEPAVDFNGYAVGDDVDGRL